MSKEEFICVVMVLEWNKAGWNLVLRQIAPSNLQASKNQPKKDAN